MHRAQRDSLPFWKAARIHTATHVGTNFFFLLFFFFYPTLARLLIRRALRNHFVFVLNNAPFVLRSVFPLKFCLCRPSFLFSLFSFPQTILDIIYALQFSEIPSNNSFLSLSLSSISMKYLYYVNFCAIKFFLLHSRVATRNWVTF